MAMDGNPVSIADPSGADGYTPGGVGGEIWGQSWGVTYSSPFNGAGADFSGQYGGLAIPVNFEKFGNGAPRQNGTIFWGSYYMQSQNDMSERVWRPSYSYRAQGTAQGIDDKGRTGMDELVMVKGGWSKAKNSIGTSWTDIRSYSIRHVGGLGDEFVKTIYGGTVLGNEGKNLNFDTSYNNGNLDGGTISVFGLTISYSLDVSFSIGYSNSSGQEFHVGPGIGNGLGQVQFGQSHTKDNITKGTQYTVKLGPGVWMAVLTYTAYSAAILAF